MSKTDLSFDAQLLLIFLAKNFDAPHDALIIQLMPEGAVNLIVDQTKPGDKNWPEAMNELMQHYVDDAQERAQAALQELIQRGFISKKPSPDAH